MNNGDRALVLAVAVLGLAIVLSITGSIVLAAMGRVQPANLTPTATGAVGALSVILGQQLAQRNSVQFTTEQLAAIVALQQQTEET